MWPSDRHERGINDTESNLTKTSTRETESRLQLNKQYQKSCNNKRWRKTNGSIGFDFNIEHWKQDTPAAVVRQKFITANNFHWVDCVRRANMLLNYGCLRYFYEDVSFWPIRHRISFSLFAATTSPMRIYFDALAFNIANGTEKHADRISFRFGFSAPKPAWNYVTMGVWGPFVVLHIHKL